MCNDHLTRRYSAYNSRKSQNGLPGGGSWGPCGHLALLGCLGRKAGPCHIFEHQTLQTGCRIAPHTRPCRQEPPMLHSASQCRGVGRSQCRTTLPTALHRPPSASLRPLRAVEAEGGASSSGTTTTEHTISVTFQAKEGEVTIEVASGDQLRVVMMESKVTIFLAAHGARCAEGRRLEHAGCRVPLDGTSEAMNATRWPSGGPVHHLGQDLELWWRWAVRDVHRGGAGASRGNWGTAASALTATRPPTCHLHTHVTA